MTTPTEQLKKKKLFNSEGKITKEINYLSDGKTIACIVESFT
ncbi:DUF2963 domain-containing protein [Candidatus Phytoplasma australiense]